jgi:pantothenate kinase-related protein Tda10
MTVYTPLKNVLSAHILLQRVQGGTLFKIFAFHWKKLRPLRSYVNESLFSYYDYLFKNTSLYIISNACDWNTLQKWQAHNRVASTIV